MSSAQRKSQDAPSAAGPEPGLYPIPSNEEMRIAALRDLEILDTLPDERFERVARLASARFGMAVSRVTFVDEARVWFKSSIGLAATQAPRAIAICSYAIMEPEPLIVRDLAADPRFANSPQVKGGPKFRFYAGAPITLPGGLRVGSVCLMDTAPHPEFSDEDAAFLVDLAEIVVHELELHRQIVRRDEQIQQTENALAVARNAKRRFMAIVSHELRTPLNAISGYLQLLKSQPSGALGDPAYEGYVDHSLQAAGRLTKLIERVLNYAAAEASEVKLCESEFGCAHFLADCRDALLPDAAERDVTIVTRSAPGAPARLYADEVQAAEIVIQLGRNAVSFSPAGGEVVIEMRSAENGAVVITVEDAGPGVPPDLLDHVMSAFTQADDGHAREHEGIGLGLAVTKTLVELHGGALSLRAREGGGACAEVVLPAYRGRAAA